jgi:hypothetical protein
MHENINPGAPSQTRNCSFAGSQFAHQTRSHPAQSWPTFSARAPTLALPYSWNMPRRSTGVVKSSSLWARARNLQAVVGPSVMSCARCRLHAATTLQTLRSLHLRKTRWNATGCHCLGFALYNVRCTSDTNTHSFQLLTEL